MLLLPMSRARITSIANKCCDCDVVKDDDDDDVYSLLVVVVAYLGWCSIIVLKMEI
jgi:hypothetical protein